jgi:hypothetical protein
MCVTRKTAPAHADLVTSAGKWNSGDFGRECKDDRVVISTHFKRFHLNQSNTGSIQGGPVSGPLTRQHPLLKKFLPKTATGDTIMRIKHAIATRIIEAGLFR